jgi:hypothetical protein
MGDADEISSVVRKCCIDLICTSEVYVIAEKVLILGNRYTTLSIPIHFVIKLHVTSLLSRIVPLRELFSGFEIDETLF